MNARVKRELFWNRVTFLIIRGYLFTGFLLTTLIFVVFSGAIAVDGLDAPALFGGRRRTETLVYGLMALALFSVATKNCIFTFWRYALKQLKEAHARQADYIRKRCGG